MGVVILVVLACVLRATTKKVNLFSVKKRTPRRKSSLRLWFPESHYRPPEIVKRRVSVLRTVKHEAVGAERNCLRDAAIISIYGARSNGNTSESFFVGL